MTFSNKTLNLHLSLWVVRIGRTPIFRCSAGKTSKTAGAPGSLSHQAHCRVRHWKSDHKTMTKDHECVQIPMIRMFLLSWTQCVFITVVPIIKMFAWGEGDSSGRALQLCWVNWHDFYRCWRCVCLLLQDHVLRETTSRGLCGLVCPSRTEGVD